MKAKRMGIFSHPFRLPRKGRGTGDYYNISMEAELSFIREGRYDSAVDRVHTAFHGYLRQLLNEHGESHTVDDSLPGLFARLHAYYGSTIQPADVGERVKMILRSAGGMVTTVNELRNNNTVAHPNGNLIQKREAQLVIRLVNAIIDYVEDIEKSISKSVSP